MADASDSRESARSKVFMMVKDDGGQSMWAQDIGLGGVRCETGSFKSPGSFVDLEFRLPGSTGTMKVSGQVLNVEPTAGDKLSMGIRFCALPNQAFRSIYRFMDERKELWGAHKHQKSVHQKALETMEMPFESLLRRAKLEQKEEIAQQKRDKKQRTPVKSSRLNSVERRRAPTKVLSSTFRHISGIFKRVA